MTTMTTITEDVTLQSHVEKMRELTKGHRPLIRAPHGDTMKAGFMFDGEFKEVMDIRDGRDIDLFIEIFDLSFVTISRR